MVFCGDIAVKSYSNEKINLKGIITGLDSSKKYCLHYFDYDHVNLPNKTQSYTYIHGVTSYDLYAHGCYRPRVGIGVGDQFSISCHETGRTCEEILKNVCGETLKLEIKQDQYVYYVVEDDSGNKVSGARVECGGDVLHTGSDGRASHILNEKDTNYYATCYPPTGYSCIDCNKSFIVHGTMVIDFKLEKESVTPSTVFVDIHVKDQHGDYVKNCTVSIPGALSIPGVVSGDSLSTGSSGVVRFNLEKDKLYVATAEPPSGYSSVSASTGSFTAIGNQSFMFKLQKDDATPTTCVLSFGVICIDPMALMPGVICRVGGKSATTGLDGTCNITVECGKPYTATCDAPDGYNCICDGCVCSDGPFTPTANGHIDTFYIAKNPNGGIPNGDPKYTNIPPEVVAVMPQDTTNIIMLELKPLSWAKFDSLKGSTLASWLLSKVGDIITYKGIIGWDCIGVSVVQTSDRKVFLPVFMRRV